MTRKTAGSQSDNINSERQAIEPGAPFQNCTPGLEQPLVLIRAQSIDRYVDRRTALDLDDGQDATPTGEDVDLSGTTAQAKAENLIAAQHQPEGGDPFRSMSLPVGLLAPRLSPGRLGPGRGFRSADPAWLHPRP